MPLSTQFYNEILPNLGGVEKFQVASCYRKRDILRSDGPLGLYADFTLPFTLQQDQLTGRTTPAMLTLSKGTSRYVTARPGATTATLAMSD